MTARAGVVIFALMAACHRAPSARERVLARLPGAAALVVAADGRALADPVVRRVIDGARARIPASFGCVIDAAFSSQAVALSGDRTGIAVAIVTHAAVPSCPALSRIAPDVWVATVGEPVLPKANAPAEITALTDPGWQRARDYLLHAPIALAGTRGQARMIGVASIDPASAAPVSAWLAIDAPEPVTMQLEHAIGAFLQRVPSFASKVATRRATTQLVYTAPALGGSDVEGLAHELVALFDAAPPQPPEHIACPPIEGEVLACTTGPRLRVHSVKSAVSTFVTAPRTVAVINGDVVGLRLGANAPQLLRKGDVVVAIDSRRVRSDAELAAVIQKIRSRATLVVRRGTEDNLIELEE